jgi:hypothetical protein
MTLPLGFPTKDVLFLVASFYLLKQDLTRAAQELKGFNSIAWKKSQMGVE